MNRGQIRRKTMRRRLLLGALLAGSVFLPLERAFSADAPTPEAIVDRFVEVTGGKAVYEKRKAEVVHGTIEFAAAGLKGTMVEYFEEPGKFYMAMDLKGVGKIESGLSEGVAWENSVLQGARIKTGDEKAQAIREAAMNIFAHWREIYPKAESAGEEVVEGEPCYKLVLTPAAGKPETMYFEKKSGLLRKTTVVAASPLGDIAAESISTEYRPFDDIVAPSKVTEKAAGQEFTITIQSMQANQEIPAEKFALPDEVKALLAKQKN
jgi:zinc protease